MTNTVRLRHVLHVLDGLRQVDPTIPEPVQIVVNDTGMSVWWDEGTFARVYALAQYQWPALSTSVKVDRDARVQVFGTLHLVTGDA